jgi:protein phosphatase
MQHPQRSILTRAIGTEPQIEVDEPAFRVRDGDRLLLCSDGLNSMLPDTEIAGVLAGKGRRGKDSPDSIAQDLVDAANKAGGYDNITVVVMDVSESEGGAADAAGKENPPKESKPKRRLFSRSHNAPGREELS